MILGFFTLSNMCDEHRRPRRGAPAADQQPGGFGKHGTAPPCPARGPEAGSPHICDFMVPVRYSPSSCTFLPSINFCTTPVVSGRTSLKEVRIVGQIDASSPPFPIKTRVFPFLRISGTLFKINNPVGNSPEHGHGLLGLVKIPALVEYSVILLREQFTDHPDAVGIGLYGKTIGKIRAIDTQFTGLVININF